MGMSMELAAVLIVLAVGLFLERGRRADVRARIIDRRRR
jgi:hypothetical protein